MHHTAMSDQPRPAKRKVRPARKRGFAPNRVAARRLGVDPADWTAPAKAFPVRWPAGYLELAVSSDGEPIRRMGMPSASELVPDAGDLADPVGERTLSQHPFVVRKHRDRAILLVTSRCHFYCRFCFRRSFPDGGHRDPGARELTQAIAWIAAEPEIGEVILSGGDPLTLADAEVERILAQLAAIPHVRSLRLHTRAPVHFPERITPALARLLARGSPLWVVTHFNHAVELTTASRRALDRLRRAGLPLLNQSVLLAGVNDDPRLLRELCRELYGALVKPYYLHHPDRVPGSARFRVTIRRGLELVAGLRAGLPGAAVPEYVIDLPDGSGKVAVASLIALGDGRYRAPSGFVFDDALSYG